MAKENFTYELIELISNGNYDIVQQYEGRDVELYEG